jgi:hypothetical protein
VGSVEIMAAISLIGMVVSAIGTVVSAANQAANQDSQANAARYNAEIQRQNAGIAREQANAKEEMQRRKTNVVQGIQRAGIAQSGLGLSESFKDIYNESAINSELDAMNTRYEGYLVSRGAENQAKLYDFQASVNDKNADNAMTAGGIGAASALLSGVGSFMKGSGGMGGSSYFGMGGFN